MVSEKSTCIDLLLKVDNAPRLPILGLLLARNVLHPKECYSGSVCHYSRYSTDYRLAAASYQLLGYNRTNGEEVVFNSTEMKHVSEIVNM